MGAYPPILNPAPIRSSFNAVQDERIKSGVQDERMGRVCCSG